MYKILRIYEYALLQHLFSSFRPRKKCEETTRLDKGTWNMWITLSECPNSRFQSRNNTLRNPVGFFNFIDLQPRYRTSGIGHLFNFKIPVITVFSRGTGGSGKQVFRMRACWSIGVCAGGCVCVCARARACMFLCVCLCVWKKNSEQRQTRKVSQGNKKNYRLGCCATWPWILRTLQNLPQRLTKLTLWTSNCFFQIYVCLSGPKLCPFKIQVFFMEKRWSLNFCAECT